MTNGKNTTTTFSSDKDEFSITSDEFDSMRCGICFEPFHPIKRAPKSLPCGHNFCEQCIFSLCCHQQYYLLDSVSCPTCRTILSTSTAFAAPTNYDLCKLLEKVQQYRGNNSINNITVIHLPDTDVSSSTLSVKRRFWRHNAGWRLSRDKRRLMRCTDCSRNLNEKRRRREARYCKKCFVSKEDDDDCLRVACLECCVNHHNGHQLVTLSELENEHQKLTSDLRSLQKNIQRTNERIEASLKKLTENSKMPSSDHEALRKTNQSLRSECEADLKFALSVIENRVSSPLAPMVLQRLRQHQYHNSARLHKLLHFIEKCNESMKQRRSRNIKLKISVLSTPRSLPISMNASFMRQTHSIPRASTSEDSLAKEAIAAVLAVECGNEEIKKKEAVEEALKVLNLQSSTKTERRRAMLCCAKNLYTFIKSTTKQTLLLYIDAYLHIFHRLNFLVTRVPCGEDGRERKPITRWDVWKLVQLVYTDLMKCAAKFWQSEQDERIDLVDDLAFLCFLYSDVSDEATITICMIEAARARAAAASSMHISTEADKLKEFRDDEQRTMNIRLNLIDEHLLECRRIQKLQQLCATTTNKPQGSACQRQQLIKRVWKLFSTCFNKAN